MKKFVIIFVAGFLASIIFYKLLWPKIAAKNTIVFEAEKVATIPYDPRANKIHSYFEHHKMPLEVFADVFVSCADSSKINYTLLPAISVIESQGGKHYPVASNNPFGWASASVNFSSVTEATCYIADKLANGKYYTGKTLEGKLKTYNSVNPNYANTVMQIMKDIDETVVIK